MACGCACGSQEKIRLLYACSGAADVGALADGVARKLMKLGTGKMTCLSGLGGDFSGFIESAKAADENVVIDGCPVGCAKSIFDRHGLSYRQFVLTGYGVEKGKAGVSEDLVNSLTIKVADELVKA